MIVITGAFAGILDDWLASLGQTNRAAVPRSSSALSLEQWTAQVHAAIAQSPGPARGFDIGRHVQLQHAGPLGYLLVNTQTLGEFLDTYLLLEKWFYGQSWAQLSREPQQVSIAWDGRFGRYDRVLEQLHIMALLTVLCSACPTVGALLRVEVTSAAEGEAAAYRAAFGCPVQFNQPVLRLVFAAEALQAPIDLSHATLSPAWRSRQRTLREAVPSATELIRAVEDAILHTLPAGAPVAAVAARLHLSPRTLQRRLTESGCSYRQLLEAIRQRHAQHLLDDPSLSLKEVAFLLGYAEQSAFNHAFQRWHNAAPRQPAG
ncbi:AraC family transcriptional regulator [Pseudomonas sp. J452]|uniref:AraC family transcriptional regulator n=1 Tax=Pseudomonas sp. J452 TaxID=2898441 RepID=UPI0021AE0B7E|nr:AraC family transcriptional regulator [Pseudomonas sp. J452]UUY10208.1 AraC family transcriptional regulator [Pseudomonas sp. J452]